VTGRRDDEGGEDLIGGLFQKGKFFADEAEQTLS
jgi:hypothetical protein